MRPKYGYTDTLFHLCLGAALLFVLAIFCGSCAHPLPDLDSIPRAQFSRRVEYVAEDKSRHACRAWLPLVVRSETGQGMLEIALRAAQPWANALGFAVAVPALEGETPNVIISWRPCPKEYKRDTAPYCMRLAQTRRWCDGDAYIQRIEIFVPGNDFQVLMHELGHVLGAYQGREEEHSPDSDSIMYVGGLTRGGAQWVRPADTDSIRTAWRMRVDR